jgi:plasmid maintenance system antidote protein VapI
LKAELQSSAFFVSIRYEKRGLELEKHTALRFSLFFGNSPQFWLGLQDDFDLEAELRQKGEEFAAIRSVAST